MPSRKINVTIQDDILQRVDTFAKSRGISRSAVLQLGADMYIKSQESMPALNNVFALMGSLAKRAATDGVDSQEYENELKELEKAQDELKSKM